MASVVVHWDRLSVADCGADSVDVPMAGMRKFDSFQGISIRR